MEAWAENIITPGNKGESMPTEGPLAGKVALITGASRGIGFAIARRLGRMGARVSICGRDQARLDQSASSLRGENIETLAVQADVAHGDQISSLIQRTQQEFGPIDILVNSAGVGLFGPFHEFGETDWSRVIDTNLKSVFLTCRAVAPDMIRRQTGHIINISSLAGKNTFANGAIYCASKWGLMGLSGSMAEDLRGYGVRVSAICPGSVATEFSGHGGKNPSNMLQPDDIAHAVAALVTQSAESFISEVHIRPTRKP
jgi:3-oxoacyl-[acyl-carrier protein] reductase